MSRYECTRCGETCFTTNPPHLCKDLAKRLERQQKAIALVPGVLVGTSWNATRPEYDAAAVEIIEALAGRDLGA